MSCHNTATTQHTHTHQSCLSLNKIKVLYHQPKCCFFVFLRQGVEDIICKRNHTVAICICTITLNGLYRRLIKPWKLKLSQSIYVVTTLTKTTTKICFFFFTYLPVGYIKTQNFQPKNIETCKKWKENSKIFSRFFYLVLRWLGKISIQIPNEIIITSASPLQFASFPSCHNSSPVISAPVG